MLVFAYQIPGYLSATARGIGFERDRKGMSMRKLCIAAVAVGGALAVPSGAAANPPNPCPPGYTRTTVYPSGPFASDSQKADRNHNGLVCQKPRKSEPAPGPDLIFIDDQIR